MADHRQMAAGQETETSTKIAWAKVGNGMKSNDGNFADKANLYQDEGILFALHGYKSVSDVFLSVGEKSGGHSEPDAMKGAMQAFAFFQKLNPSLELPSLIDAFKSAEYSYTPTQCPPFKDEAFTPDDAKCYSGVMLATGVKKDRVDEVKAMAREIGGEGLADRILVHVSNHPLIVDRDIKFPSNCGINRDGTPMGPDVEIKLADIQLNLELVSEAREFFNVPLYAKRNGRTTTKVVARYSEADAAKKLFPITESPILNGPLN